MHLLGYFGQIVADQIHDGIVFVDLFGVGFQFLFCFGQLGIDGSFHGIGIDMAVFDFDKTLGGIDHKVVLVQ